MANARLMQQTLAQFDIEVQMGDITKGPTITRYELHPAPGVKLEKIAGLSNNIAAALRAERINILAPVPGNDFPGGWPNQRPAQAEVFLQGQVDRARRIIGRHRQTSGVIG